MTTYKIATATAGILLSSTALIGCSSSTHAGHAVSESPCHMGLRFDPAKTRQCDQDTTGKAFQGISGTAVTYDAACVTRTAVRTRHGKTVHPYTVKPNNVIGQNPNTDAPFRPADVAHCATLKPTVQQCQRWASLWNHQAVPATGYATLKQLGCVKEAESLQTRS